MSHDRMSERCAAAGFKGFCSENVAWNMERDLKGGCAKAMDQWKKSPGHYQNMMRPESTIVGYGYHQCQDGKIYYTTMFSKGEGSPVGPAAPEAPKAPAAPTQPAPSYPEQPVMAPKQPSYGPPPSYSPPPPAPAAPSPGGAYCSDKYIQMMVSKNNEMRGSALKCDEALCKAAMEWSVEQCRVYAPHQYTRV
jgi:hypothetical protein